MRLAGTILGLALVALAASCSSETNRSEPAPDDGGVLDAANDDGGATEIEAGGSQDAGPDAPPCTPPATPPVVVFLNKDGGTYTPGFDDSRTNLSSIVNQTTVAPAWTVTPGAWQTLLDCVKQKFAPFNVQVTDVDPGNAAHFEIAFVHDGFLGFAAPAVAPFKCDMVPNGIGFVVQSYADANPANACALAVYNVANMLGIEPVAACPDAMSFDVASCPSAPFSNTPLPCGTNAPANCMCGGGTTQTSFAKMLAAAGPRCL